MILSNDILVLLNVFKRGGLGLGLGLGKIEKKDSNPRMMISLIIGGVFSSLRHNYIVLIQFVVFLSYLG